MYKFILFLCFYLPFQVALNPTQGIDLSSIRAIIILLFLLWLAKGLKEKRIIIKKSLVTALILIFLFLNSLSFAVSCNMEWSVRKLLFLFSIFPIYFVVSDIVSSSDKMEKMVRFLIWGGSFAALVGIVQFFLQFAIGLEKTYRFWANYVSIPFLGNAFSKAVLENPSWLVNISGKTYLRATATFPDPHMFSFFLGILIPLAIGLFLKAKKIRYLLIAAALFLADILTFSRGGYVGLFAGSAAMFFMFWSKFSIRYKITAFSAGIFILSVLFIRSPISERFWSSLNLAEGSNAGRLEMWEKAGKVTLDKPFLGVGIGNYPLEIKPSAGYREPIYAHNTYLDIASETGIMNALAWIGILAFSMKVFLKKSREESLFLWLAVSMVIFSAHSLVETAIYSPVVLTLFLIVIGFSNVRTKDEKDI